ncbi:DUF1894 domain-containing protein [Methanococcus voltae]|uniref:DUF1894 domain-containing protein n=2 Tax=Methanococcus voltae TaxID=2188 RepID=A0A8J7S276_METVO|nr:DUF1894 domain-containing protein [Methanococcus voltae]MBP2172949.1 hypothetical protein [Methanococcus voltae]MBP2201995.1 hypothetical protein [Methanococcus voltae]MCS3922158.1 hypothetical protein [Methanococcus voltae PS]
MASCIDQYHYEILLKGSFKECNDYIRENSKSIVEINPGDEILDGVMIIGVPPIYMGFNDDNVLFPYTKPCYGTHVLRISMDSYMKCAPSIVKKSEEDEKDNEDKNKKQDVNKEIEEDKEVKEEKKGILSKLKFW